MNAIESIRFSSVYERPLEVVGDLASRVWQVFYDYVVVPMGDLAKWLSELLFNKAFIADVVKDTVKDLLKDPFKDWVRQTLYEMLFK